MGRLNMVIGFMERNKRTFQVILGIFVVIVILSQELRAQSMDGFIYGKVYTIDNTYQGFIRWGKEEAYWNDTFDAAKVSNEYYKKIPVQQKKDDGSWWNYDWRLSSIWDNKNSQTTHKFSCQFGDIAYIKPGRDNIVTLGFKNGMEMMVNGSGYNDIGSSIKIIDDEIGSLTVAWHRVRKVEFLPAQRGVTNGFGDPIYGTIETTRKGSFTGFVQWDHDERVGKDKLDGDTRGSDVSIAFSKIKNIEKKDRGSIVVLSSGREFYLTNSNDVNGGNRGIIVSTDGIGKIDIPWRIFKQADFTKTNNSGKSYNTYTGPKALTGTVYLYNDSEVKGRIVYDMNEAFDLEILKAKDDEIEYRIPFRNIKKIQPKNYDYSLVSLKNGESLLLGGMRDVSDSNSGLLVITNKSKEPTYIEWKKISEIIFD